VADGRAGARRGRGLARAEDFLARPATALHALRRNVMRSVLTCLGIIIGIAAVIAMMEIGGVSSRSSSRPSPAWSGVVQVDPADVSVGGVSSGRGGRVTLTPGGRQGHRHECTGCRRCAHGWTVGARSSTPIATGVRIAFFGWTPDYLRVRNWPVAEGERSRSTMYGARPRFA